MKFTIVLNKREVQKFVKQGIINFIMHDVMRQIHKQALAYENAEKIEKAKKKQLSLF